MSVLELPVVDVQDWRAGGMRREHFVRALGDSLQTWGFVAVTGHGIPVDHLRAAYATARAFFDLPPTQKASFEFPDQGRQRGYTGFGVEHAKDQSTPDLKEFWQVGRDLGPDHPLVTSGQMPDNVWPDAPAGFAEAMGTLFQGMDSFATELLDAIGIWLGLDEGAFPSIIQDGNSVMRIIHYPPVRGDLPPGAVRAAAHEDINLLTVLPTSTQPGLELWDRHTSTWLSVVTPPDVMICDTGDIMARFTNGRLPATTHRVVNPPGTANVARFSLPFFCHPRPDWIIRPLSGDAPAITAGAFLAERLRAIGLANQGDADGS